MKIVLVTGTWGRPKVFELFTQGVKNLPKVKGVKLEVVVAGSEGKWSRERVKKHGFHYIEVSNHPLASKMNATLDKARKLKADYVLCMGSDDIISPELYKMYLKILKKGADFIGVTDFYFYDLKSRKAIYWAGYRESYRWGLTCGAGRMLSKELLDKLDWELWDDEHSYGLDHGMQLKLNRIEHTSCTFSMKDYGLFAVDIKSPENMTPFALWDNSSYIKRDLIYKHFPYLSCADWR